VETPASFEIGAGRGRSRRRCWHVRSNGAANERCRPVDVVVRCDEELDPVRFAPTQGDPLVALELISSRPDDGLREPNVEGALLIEVGDLAPANPDRRPGNRMHLRRRRRPRCWSSTTQGTRSASHLIGSIVVSGLGNAGRDCPRTPVQLPASSSTISSCSVPFVETTLPPSTGGVPSNELHRPPASSTMS
jgi:hypothetical protein